jgi:N-methylhydantoinase A
MLSVAVDIGGTFTDVVCRNERGQVQYFKIPTTRKDESIAVLEAVQRISTDWELPASEIHRFAHGTTVATNAVLERSGAKLGLITTKGFRDVLEIGRQMRQQMYHVILEPQTPVFLAPREQRREVTERIDATGQICTPLDEDEVRAAVSALVAKGVEAIAVCFLFSFANPVHELRVKEIIRQEHPELFVSVSHEVDPAFREYERTAITAFDAYLKPVIDRYLGHLESDLASSGIGAPLQVMQSRGGLMASSVTRRRPVRLFLSGPAAGVIGSRAIATRVGVENLITVDIGGTSCDIALISSGKPIVRAEGAVDGYPIRVPMVDVNSIGSGGGSIAWLDTAQGLRVGPKSAGSEPGPACYGRGGTLPTVTDASVVLGYVDPDYFAGGSLGLDVDRARRAISDHIAKPLGLSLHDAALGIHRVLNAQMSEGIRMVSVRQGFDPRQFAMLPLGGGGGIHVTALARSLHIGRVVVPKFPGVLSAFGLLAAPVEHEVSMAFGQDITSLDVSDVSAAFADLDARAGELMSHESTGDAPTTINYFADVCYIGQSYSIEVPLNLGDERPLQTLYDQFMELHTRIYGYSTHGPARIVNLRTVHQAAGSDRPRDEVHQMKPGIPVKGVRNVLVAGDRDFVEASILDRWSLPPGYTFQGPAVLEQPDTTTLVEPGWRGTVLETGDIMLHSEE